jgi:hypothetical protein
MWQRRRRKRRSRTEAVSSRTLRYKQGNSCASVATHSPVQKEAIAIFCLKSGIFKHQKNKIKHSE